MGGITHGAHLFCRSRQWSTPQWIPFSDEKKHSEGSFLSTYFSEPSNSHSWNMIRTQVTTVYCVYCTITVETTCAITEWNKICDTSWWICNRRCKVIAQGLPERVRGGTGASNRGPASWWTCSASFKKIRNYYLTTKMTVQPASTDFCYFEWSIYRWSFNKNIFALCLNKIGLYIFQRPKQNFWAIALKFQTYLVKSVTFSRTRGFLYA